MSLNLCIPFFHWFHFPICRGFYANSGLHYFSTLYLERHRSSIAPAAAGQFCPYFTGFASLGGGGAARNKENSAPPFKRYSALAKADAAAGAP